MNGLNAAVLVSSDAECKSILLDAGVLTGMTPEPGANFCAVPFKHGGYYCLGIHDYGLSDGDNGYSVIMLPMNTTGEDDARKFFTSLLSDLIKGGSTFVKDVVPYRPELN